MTTNEEIKLTQFSHGAGCGCKIAPGVLEEILKSNFIAPANDKLIVGNSSKDDAAVYDIGNGQGIISTTDFFMPIVDSAFDFGWLGNIFFVERKCNFNGQTGNNEFSLAKLSPHNFAAVQIDIRIKQNCRRFGV